MFPRSDKHFLISEKMLLKSKNKKSISYRNVRQTAQIKDALIILATSSDQVIAKGTTIHLPSFKIVYGGDLIVQQQLYHCTSLRLSSYCWVSLRTLDPELHLVNEVWRVDDLI